MTSLDLNKSPKSHGTCAPISDLPSNISTKVPLVIQASSTYNSNEEKERELREIERETERATERRDRDRDREKKRGIEKDR